MIVCVCHRVSDREIAHAVRSGCASFDELQFDLGVATACGKCHDCARETFEHHAAQTGSCEAAGACTGHASPRKIVPIAAQLRIESAAPAAA